MTQFENLLARAPEACTLPTVARPLRVTQFADLFATALGEIERKSPTVATVMLPRELLDTARDLAARETECCSFFDFTVEADGDHTALTIRVPSQYTEVLTALTSLLGRVS
ncbi:hypothetical protein [Microbacterium deminutum]|uniref:Uncharacterized protein n=1 Tax=Microbacterium deminutum TaxID=344164 RepID=A0ABN2Q553_9MICO